MTKYLQNILNKRIISENMAAGLGTMASPAKVIVEPYSTNPAFNKDEQQQEQRKRIKNNIIKNKINSIQKGDIVQ